MIKRLQVIMAIGFGAVCGISPAVGQSYGAFERSIDRAAEAAARGKEGVDAELAVMAARAREIRRLTARAFGGDPEPDIDPKGEDLGAWLTRRRLTTDRRNAERLQAMLVELDTEWITADAFGPDAAANAVAILLNGDATPEFQARMAPVLDRLRRQGAIAPEFYARIYDRVAVRRGRPQRYGTRLECKRGAFQPAGSLEDPLNLDARRAAVGLEPWTDSLRRYPVRCG